MLINIRNTKMNSRVIEYLFKKEEIIERKNRECSESFLRTDDIVIRKNTMPEVLSRKSEMKLNCTNKKLDRNK